MLYSMLLCLLMFLSELAFAKKPSYTPHKGDILEDPAILSTMKEGYSAPSQPSSNPSPSSSATLPETYRRAALVSDETNSLELELGSEAGLLKLSTNYLWYQERYIINPGMSAIYFNDTRIKTKDSHHLRLETFFYKDFTFRDFLYVNVYLGSSINFQQSKKIQSKHQNYALEPFVGWDLSYSLSDLVYLKLENNFISEEESFTTNENLKVASNPRKTKSVFAVMMGLSF